MASFLAVAALAGFTGTAASAAPSASPVNGTWGAVQYVQGLSLVTTITSISCTGPGDCTAGGAWQKSDTYDEVPDSAYVVSEVNGTWGTAEAVPGTEALNTGLNAVTTAVSCSSPGNCVAVGYYAYLYGKSGVGTAGFVDNQVNGVWGTARPVPALSSDAHFAQLNAVSCAPASTAAARKAGLNCVAAGVSDRSPTTTAGFTLAEVNGTWGTVRPVGSAVTSVSCPFRGTCGIGGYYVGTGGHRQAFVANEVSGTWRTAQEVPGTSTLNAGGDASVTSVSCPATLACAAAGTYQPKKGPEQLFVVSESAGQWKTAIQLPGSAKLVTASGSTIGEVSCASATVCEVGGTLQTATATTRGFLASETSGQWSALSVVPGGLASKINALSCPAPGYCAAGGQLANSNPDDLPDAVIVLDEAAGHWGRPVVLHNGTSIFSGTESVTAISCPAPRDCGAGGMVSGFQADPGAFVVNETPVK